MLGHGEYLPGERRVPLTVALGSQCFRRFTAWHTGESKPSPVDTTDEDVRRTYDTSFQLRLDALARTASHTFWVSSASRKVAVKQRLTVVIRIVEPG